MAIQSKRTPWGRVAAALTAVSAGLLTSCSSGTTEISDTFTGEKTLVCDVSQQKNAVYPTQTAFSLHLRFNQGSVLEFRHSPETYDLNSARIDPDLDEGLEFCSKQTRPASEAPITEKGSLLCAQYNQSRYEHTTASLSAPFTLYSENKKRQHMMFSMSIENAITYKKIEYKASCTIAP